MAPDHSLRRRLLTWLLASVALAWAVTTILTYRHAHHELDELLDAHLARAARMLMAQASEELAEIRFDRVDDPGPYGQDIAVQLWRGEKLVLHTSGAPESRLSLVESGFSDAEVAGRNWRVFSGWDVDHDILVQVAEDHAVRERLLAHYTLSAIPALFFGLPLLGVLVWVIVGEAVRPIAILGDEVNRRGPADLRALDVTGVPREIAPLVARLNALFARISESMQAERRFTSHAAHELRTPIAAIRAQAEVARDSRDATVRDTALDRVVQGCDRAARLVEQMLLLARIDERASQQPQLSARLDQAAARVIAELAPDALLNGVVLELESDEPVELVADRALIDVLLRNLIENAIRHGGAPGPVTVRCRRQGDQVALEVADRGPGVAADELERLGQRFFRGKAAHATGSGLGLSIVQRIAETYAGSVAYRAPARGSGLVVSVTFPASGTR